MCLTFGMFRKRSKKIIKNFKYREKSAAKLQKAYKNWRFQLNNFKNVD